MQVIDVKGALVGVVRDVGVNLNEKQLVLFVTTRARTDIEIAWSDIQSVEDVVLLVKPVETPLAPAQAPPSTASPTVTTGPVICPKCKFAAPAHAKFCPKCGSSIK
jgi:hypothetical protein